LENDKNWTELQGRNKKYETAINFVLRTCYKPRKYTLLWEL